MVKEFVTQRRLNLRLPSELCAAALNVYLSLFFLFSFFLPSEINQLLFSKSDDLVVVLFEREREREREREKTRAYSICMCVFSLFCELINFYPNSVPFEEVF